MILLLSLLISFGASAKTYLVPCNGDNTKVCQIKTNQAPGNALCQRPDSEFDGDGSVYDVRIVKIPDGFIGSFLDLIGLGNDRPWARGEIVADNERIVCTIDQDKVDAKEDARLAKEAEEKAKKDKKNSDWTTACGGAKVGSVEALICEERGY